MKNNPGEAAQSVMYKNSSIFQGVVQYLISLAGLLIFGYIIKRCYFTEGKKYKRLAKKIEEMKLSITQKRIMLILARCIEISVRHKIWYSHDLKFCKWIMKNAYNSDLFVKKKSEIIPELKHVLSFLRDFFKVGIVDLRRFIDDINEELTLEYALTVVNNVILEYNIGNHAYPFTDLLGQKARNILPTESTVNDAYLASIYSVAIRSKTKEEANKRIREFLSHHNGVLSFVGVDIKENEGLIRTILQNIHPFLKYFAVYSACGKCREFVPQGKPHILTISEGMSWIKKGQGVIRDVKKEYTVKTSLKSIGEYP